MLTLQPQSILQQNMQIQVANTATSELSVDISKSGQTKFSQELRLMDQSPLTHTTINKLKSITNNQQFQIIKKKINCTSFPFT